MAVHKKKPSEFESMVAQIAYPEYLELSECREIVDDCLAGQRTIKSKMEYLPPNAWQRKHPDQYNAFLYRALFPGETEYALEIYNGLFSIGEPTITLPPDGRLDYMINTASVYGDGLKQVQIRLNNEQMSHGLRCMLLEVRSDRERPFMIREYDAGKFLRSHFTSIDGESVCDFILIDESTMEFSPEDMRDYPVFRFRVFALDADGYYYQRRCCPKEVMQGFDYLNPPQDDETVYPSVSGVRFTRIPFVWCNANGLSGSSFDNPPLLPMAQTEIKLYMAMAYHSQHIYMNTQEFLVFTGVGKDFDIGKVTVGAGAGVSLDKPDAKAFYVSTNGVGFTAEAEEITELKAMIEEKRLSLMSAKSHQSGTVVGLMQNSQSAPLRRVVNVSGEAITQILRYACRWLGYGDDVCEAVKYIPCEQFASPRVNLSEFISLCRAVMDGDVMMLEEDLFKMAKDSGFITTKMPWDVFKRKYSLEFAARQDAMGMKIVLPSARQDFPAVDSGQNADS